MERGMAPSIKGVWIWIEGLEVKVLVIGIHSYSARVATKLGVAVQGVDARYPREALHVTVHRQTFPISVQLLRRAILAAAQNCQYNSVPYADDCNNQDDCRSMHPI